MLISCVVVVVQCVAFFTASRDWRVATDILAVLLGASVLALIVVLLRGHDDHWFRIILGSLVIVYLLFWGYIWWSVRYGSE